MSGTKNNNGAMNKAMAVRTFFGKELYPELAKFREEWNQLDDASKQELGELAAGELGIELKNE